MRFHSVFPQLYSQNVGDDIWILILQNIEYKREKDAESSAGLIEGLITECVTQIVDCLPAFPTRKTRSDTDDKVSKEVDLDRIMGVIRLCVSTNNLELCGRVAANLVFTESRRFLSPWIYYAKLCTELEVHLQCNQTPFTVLRAFFVDAADSLFVCAAETGLSRTHTGDLSSLLVSLRCGGGISFLKERRVYGSRHSCS
jgi:hypothetical protein